MRKNLTWGVKPGFRGNVKAWIQRLDLNYPILVAPDETLCALYNSRMVPSFFLINREGEIVKNLVGYKSASILDRAFNLVPTFLRGNTIETLRVGQFPTSRAEQTECGTKPRRGAQSARGA